MGRKEKNIVGLDIGSTKICALIAAPRETGLEAVGVCEVEARGLKKGVVVHLEETVESIKRCVVAAEAMAACEIENVFVGLGGPHIRSFNSRGLAPIGARPREITGDDVRRAVETARTVALSPDREIIHILPQEFIVDGQGGIGDPTGMMGTRLEVNAHIVTSTTTAAQNIVTAVNRSGLTVSDTVLEPIAAGEATLTDDEKELGCVLVDVGGGTTSLAIYHHGAVCHTTVLPLGGEHFTNDIAVGLRTSIPEADRLKREQGCALASLAHGGAEFEVVSAGSRGVRTIAQPLLSEILQPRAEEILHFVRDEVRRAGFDNHIGSGVVLTGGGALLRGLPELAESLLNLPARLGFPEAFQDSKLQDPRYSTAVGLVLYGERKRRSREFHEPSASGFRRMLSKVRALM